MSDSRRLLLLLGVVALLSGCGQTGKLYLPEPAGEIVTRPAQTPPPEGDAGTAPADSPQSADSPPQRKDKKDDKKN
jgi:hypothetical protein